MRPPAPLGRGRASSARRGGRIPATTARRGCHRSKERGGGGRAHKTAGERGRAPGQGLAFTNSSNIPGRCLRVMHRVGNVSHYNYESFRDSVTFLKLKSSRWPSPLLPRSAAGRALQQLIFDVISQTNNPPRPIAPHPDRAAARGRSPGTAGFAFPP